MFKTGEEIYCGVFDSSILRKNQSKSLARVVNCYELELFHAAGGVSYVDEKRHPTRRGMLLCTKPGQVRHSDFPVRCSFIRVMPGGEENRDVEEILLSLPDCIYIENVDGVEELLGLFAKLSARCMSTAEDKMTDVRVNGIFLEILYRVMRLGGEEGDAAAALPVSRIVQDAREYIEEHYCGEYSLKSMAQALSLSPNYLHSVFKKHTGKTPFAHVTARRVELAKRLIMAGEKSMLEIALETGFCSQSHFNKVFKAETGSTPAEYRRKMPDWY